MNHSKKLYNGMQSAINRRINVINRLENQLKSGTKTEKGSTLTKATSGLNQIPLSEKDIKRIKSELLTLKNRI